jgi:putative hydrolase of the HAD superfamily
MKKAIIFDFNRTLYDPDANQLMQGAENVLRALKQAEYKMFLIGKGTEERTTLIRDLGLEVFFDEIIVKDEKDFNDFLRLKNQHPEHEFYSVGDRVRKEIKYSNQVGCKTVWFKKGKFAVEEPVEAEEKPWRIIAELHELLDILPLK